MADHIRLNGHPVHAHSLMKRDVEVEDGTTRRSYEISVMIRGRVAHRQFFQVLNTPTVRFEQPPNPAFDAEVVERAVTTVGEGESTIYRFDISLLESAAAATERSLRSAADARLRQIGQSTISRPPKVSDEQPDQAPELPASETIWATALRQMAGKAGTLPDLEPEPEPLSTAELAGVEAILVGLRVESLIAELDAAGVIRRDAVDGRFMRLLQTRFVGEATPVVGEDAARRAHRDVMRPTE